MNDGQPPEKAAILVDCRYRISQAKEAGRSGYRDVRAERGRDFQRPIRLCVYRHDVFRLTL
jgi:hypothetical protein